jgi:N-acyl-phosphatidylethanolamine-hydrolysing phospholipase D
MASLNLQRCVAFSRSRTSISVWQAQPRRISVHRSLVTVARSQLAGSFSRTSSYYPSSLTYTESLLLAKGSSTASHSNCLQQQQGQQLQQRRHYLYLPTSWTELKLRMRAAAERRTIRVKLLMDKSRAYLDNKYTTVRHRLDINTNDSQDRKKFKEWMVRQESWVHSKRADLKTRRQAARLRLKNNTQAYKQNMIVRTRRRWLHMKNFWNRKAAHMSITKPVTLHEYSEAAWFDEAGRPLTSKDETGRFVNPWLSQSTDGVHSLGAILKWRWERLQREWAEHRWDFFRQKVRGLFMPFALAIPESTGPPPMAPPVLDAFDGSDPDKVRLTWIGHSTCLVQNGDTTILTDPIFSVRASPYQNSPIGVARQVPPSLTIAELPDIIDLCLISHDHYDHMDKQSILQLRNKVSKWVVPMGISDWLQEKCDIPAEYIVELEWWESVRLEKPKDTHIWNEVQRENTVTRPIHPAAAGMASTSASSPSSSSQPQSPTSTSIWLTCCPVQHWASRTYFDRNYRLWCSWAVFFSDRSNFFFGGDTALPPAFPLFEQISDYIGPIDLAALPIGAYEPAYFMHQAHMDPFEAVFVHKALRVKKSVAIHWGSFDLAEEPMDEPPQLLREAVHSDRVPVDFVAIPHGSSIEVVREESSSILADVDNEDSALEEEEEEDYEPVDTVKTLSS